MGSMASFQSNGRDWTRASCGGALLSSSQKFGPEAIDVIKPDRLCSQAATTRVPGRIFTPQERKRLDAFPSEIAEADLIRYFTLSRSDLDLVRRQRGDQNRIGFALQLCALRYMGFCPDDLEIVPTTALAFVADQLQASPATLHVYGHGRRLGRSIYSRFNSAWDFAMQRARTSVRWLTGCWHAPWNTTNQACCFSSRVSICTLKKSAPV